MRQRGLSLTAGARHGWPARVWAPQRRHPSIAAVLRPWLLVMVFVSDDGERRALPERRVAFPRQRAAEGPLRHHSMIAGIQYLLDYPLLPDGSYGRPAVHLRECLRFVR